MTRFATRLAEVAEKFTSRKALADAVGVSPSQITDWINERNRPTEKSIERIARKIGVHPGWLLGHEARAVSRAGIPIRACGSAADTLGICHVAEGWTPYDTKHIILPKHIHAVRVHGDSMIPVALDGQYALVADAEAESGDLAVIECRDGRIMIKRVSITDHVVSAASLNPDPHYKPIILKRSEIRRMRKIVGVWMQKI